MFADWVVVRVPAETSAVVLVRTAAAAVGAGADFTLDGIEDFKLAVNEACGLLLADTLPGSELTARFETSGSVVTADLSCPSRSGEPPRRDTVHWMLFSALVDSIESRVEDGSVHLLLRSHGVGALTT